MNTTIAKGGLLGMALCLMVCGGQAKRPGNEPEKDPVKAFQDALKTAVGDIAKRDVVIKAIDDGLIKLGTPLADVRQLFGEQFLSGGRDKAGRTTGYVHFLRFPVRPEDQPPTSQPGPPVAQPPDIGWAIHLDFSREDKIECYWLTDTGKGAKRLTSDKITPTERKTFQDSYGAAVDAKARRAVVLKAVDDNLTYPGMLLADVKSLFEDTQIIQGREEDGIAVYVSLDPPAPHRKLAKPKKKAVPPLGRGWYLELKCFPSGKQVVNYRLSNVQKR